MSKKDNNIAEVRDSLVSLMNFVKEQTTLSLVDQSPKLNMNIEEIRKLAFIVESSITASFIKGMDQVVDASKKK